MLTFLNYLLVPLQAGILVVGLVACAQMNALRGMKFLLGFVFTCLSVTALAIYTNMWIPPLTRFGLNQGPSYTLLSAFLLVLVMSRVTGTTRHHSDQ